MLVGLMLVGLMLVGLDVGGPDGWPSQRFYETQRRKSYSMPLSPRQTDQHDCLPRVLSRHGLETLCKSMGSGCVDHCQLGLLLGTGSFRKKRLRRSWS